MPFKLTVTDTYSGKDMILVGPLDSLAFSIRNIKRYADQNEKDAPQKFSLILFVIGYLCICTLFAIYFEARPYLWVLTCVRLIRHGITHVIGGQEHLSMSMIL